MKRAFCIPIMALAVFALILGGSVKVPAAEGTAKPTPGADWPKSVIVGSGPVGGGLNMLASGLCPIWEKAMEIPFTISPGTMVANVELFRNKEFTIFLSASPFGKSAYEGTKEFPWKGGPLTELRLAFNLYSNPWFFVALKKSGMTKVSQLKGKRIAFSGGAAVWDIHASLTLPCEGIAYDADPKKPRDVKVSYGTVDEVGQMLADGLIDAGQGMLEGLIPQPGILKVMQERDCILLDWNQDCVSKRVGATVMAATTIKKDLMPKYLQADFPTYNGGINNVSVHASLPDDFVYWLTRICHENLDNLVKVNPYWGYSKKYPEILIEDVGIPFHPGAIKYWKEKGLWKGK